jgi:hypothetical protein
MVSYARRTDSSASPKQKPKNLHLNTLSDPWKSEMDVSMFVFILKL